MQPCLICQKRFKPLREAKYCSSKCRGAAWAALNRDKKNEINRLSMAKRREIENRERVNTVLNCVVCNKEFVQSRHHPEQKCCSTNCNSKWFRSQPENREKILEWKRKSYSKNKHENQVKRRHYKDILRFSGNRLRALERDKYTCQNCGYIGPETTSNRSEDVVVHHIDFSGKSSRPNNKMENLQTLCRPCHIRLHTHKIIH